MQQQLKSSPVLLHLHLAGEPLTFQNYMEMSYGHVPEHLTAEEVASLPEIIQKQVPESLTKDTEAEESDLTPTSKESIMDGGLKALSGKS